MIRFLFPLALLLVSCNAHEGMQKITLSSGEKSVTLWVEIADEPAEQSQGIMNRETLDENSGMLFVFSEPRIHSFWMKNTLIPLDVLYFDEEGKFVSVQTMNPCEHDPCKTYPSARPAKYALEVNAGFTAKEGVGEGWKLDMK